MVIHAHIQRTNWSKQTRHAKKCRVDGLQEQARRLSSPDHIRRTCALSPSPGDHVVFGSQSESGLIPYSEDQTFGLDSVDYDSATGCIDVFNIFVALRQRSPNGAASVSNQHILSLLRLDWLSSTLTLSSFSRSHPEGHRAS